MGVKNGSGKPKWKAGVQMPMYSGKSWEELEDIWPADLRIASDAYKIVSLFYPAQIVAQEFQKHLIGEAIGMRDLMTLCWFQRVEDAKENVGLEAFPTMKVMNYGGRLFYARKSKITRLGLIENMPMGMRMYRITANGKLVIRNFVENLEKANDNLAMWISVQKPAMAAEITRYIQRFFDIEPSEGKDDEQQGSPPNE